MYIFMNKKKILVLSGWKKSTFSGAMTYIFSVASLAALTAVGIASSLS